MAQNSVFLHPTYSTFVRDVFNTASTSWNRLDPKYKQPNEWFNLMLQYGQVTWFDIILVAFLAILWTALRSFLTKNVFKPIVQASDLRAKEAQKAPESAWKLLFYLTVWSYSTYLLFFTEHNFFFDPSLAFKNWNVKAKVPLEIYIAYAVQFSFYIHSIYATLYVDIWRKDSIVMLLHHVVTSLLIGFSYTFRYTNVGVLVLFLHDVTDISLEMTKLMVYYKTKGGKWETVCDTLSTLGFLSFGFTWFVFRLYWFPLKALYASGYTSYILNPETLILYHLFNGLLWTLLCMNIYWFSIIVVTAYKVVTGQMKEVKDSREYDEDEQRRNSLRSSHLQNGKIE